MRKTDRKRRQITDAAYRLFRSNGFEKTTMAQVAAAVGGSKATIYNYFSSKEDLFVECVTSICDDYLAAAFAGLKDPKADLSAALLSLSKATPRSTCTPEMVAARRLLIAQADRSGTGGLFYRKTMQYIEELAAFLGRAMDSGGLRKDDPLLAAQQLRALVEAALLERCLFNAEAVPPSAATISRTASNAVKLFFRIYAPAAEGDG
jgi:AcrR family transcriptional regulator